MQKKAVCVAQTAFFLYICDEKEEKGYDKCES